MLHLEHKNQQISTTEKIIKYSPKKLLLSWNFSANMQDNFKSTETILHAAFLNNS